MKKWIMFFVLGCLTGINGFGQVDDKYVTAHLSVNTSDMEFSEFFQGFEDGLQMVKSGKITSLEELGTHYGVDMKTIRNLDQVIADLREKEEAGQVSIRFASQLLGIRDNIGKIYHSGEQIRTALKDMAVRNSLSPTEEKALAYIDISMQELARDYEMGDVSEQARFAHNQNTQISGSIPGWLRCVFGILGGLITGGLQGANVGSHLGGSHGAVVGGVIGGIGGIISAATQFCQLFIRQQTSDCRNLLWI